jgi:diacylglycerol kinase family enzyme
VRALHVSSLRVHTDHPLDVALDGEIIGNLPADFEVAGEALRVITPLEFEDIDD